MKKILLILSICNILLIHAIMGQTQGVSPSDAMNYQAVARDATGKILANQQIILKISFSANTKEKQAFYTEVHQVTTDELGLFNLVIGEGKEPVGAMKDIPWATEQIWLDVALKTKVEQAFSLMGSVELRSVPYAFHAATASQLVNESSAIELPMEKNQSIYWTTSGNTNTSPPVHFLGTRDNKDFVLKTNNTERIRFLADGRIRTFSVCPDNGDENPESYALVVKGCNQGLYIKVNGQRSNDNNFLTFADDEDIHGAVEGETSGELASSWGFISQNALFAMQTAALTAEMISEGAEGLGHIAAAATAAASILLAWAAPGFTLASTGDIANGVSKLAEITALGLEIVNFNAQSFAEVGVSYSSGSADYAEWLERAKGEPDLHYGDIVAVNGGEISLNTTHGSHYMVVSKHPLAVGNAPQPDQKYRYEKVAFMGQVLVKVAGKVDIGDYILPSGNHDGVGIAVKPSEMKIADFAKVIGVAWEAAKDAPLNYVNVAIGLKKNGLAPKVEEISNKVDNIIAYLEGKAPLHPSNQASTGKPTVGSGMANVTSAPAAKMMSDEQFDQYLNDHAQEIKNNVAKVQAELIKQGQNFDNVPELKAYFSDPIQTIKKMRKDPWLSTQWAQFDRKLLEKK